MHKHSQSGNVSALLSFFSLLEYGNDNFAIIYVYTKKDTMSYEMIIVDTTDCRNFVCKVTSSVTRGTHCFSD